MAWRDESGGMTARTPKPAVSAAPREFPSLQLNRALTSSVAPMYLLIMTANQIIHEIAALSPEEQSQVIRFARSLDVERQLTPKELSALAERLAESTESEQTATLRERITRGFYGAGPDA